MVTAFPHKGAIQNGRRLRHDADTGHDCFKQPSSVSGVRRKLEGEPTHPMSGAAILGGIQPRPTSEFSTVPRRTMPVTIVIQGNYLRFDPAATSATLPAFLKTLPKAVSC